MIRIRSGQELFTGKFTRGGWTLEIPGQKSTKFPTLAAAKKAAMDAGATGEWERIERQDGRHTRIVYLEKGARE